MNRCMCTDESTYRGLGPVNYIYELINIKKINLAQLYTYAFSSEFNTAIEGLLHYDWFHMILITLFVLRV